MLFFQKTGIFIYLTWFKKIHDQRRALHLVIIIIK